MKPFRSARFIRMGEWQEQSVAEVEAYVEGEQNPLSVSIAWDGTQYRAVRVLRNHANRELDWYDNDLHQAFEQVQAPSDRQEGKEWVLALLATDGLQARLEQEADLKRQAATNIRG
ncbi:hypothetical protein DUZ99_00045 [Xylanibacillus composti]|uniref:Uncharacterized protein n=1 Tax=Xylanibacillus composti TaxID=1572762 RepID=A0A8J4H446_9BACL|nr:hypothetical protein [Xylanibacillus composti]MDT9723405.1 hypothetical protein [Xylanibacillus composti]GIQ68559.1 hypothetical protein XYCOK13_13830 [Xylanibacillus composti]